MIRPISHPATGRWMDIAAATPGDIAFLADLRENLLHYEHGLLCGDLPIYVFRLPDGGFSVRHYPGSGHHGEHRVIPESDEHKRGKDYASGELDRFGLPSGQEVRTDNRTRHDVATLKAPRIMAVEFQAYNDLHDREYKTRTTRAMRATAFTGKHARALPDGGVLPLWVHGFGMPGGWSYPVPSIAAQDTSWDVMPKPGSVTAIGVRDIQAEPCRPGSRWPACPRTGRGWCGSPHPIAVLRPGLRVGEVAAMVANAQLVPIRYHNGAVYLVSPAHAALDAELGGSDTWVPGLAGERASAHKLGPCMYQRHEEQVAAAAAAARWEQRERLRAEAAQQRREEERAAQARYWQMQQAAAEARQQRRVAEERREQVRQEAAEARERERECLARALRGRERLSVIQPPVHAPIRRGVCQVPACEAPAALYPAGFLCDKHKPHLVKGA